jgi:hypothetical protein
LISKATLLLALLLAWHSPAGAASIFGNWKLDVENSDDAAKTLKEAASDLEKKRTKWLQEPTPKITQWRAPLPLLQAKTLIVKMRGEQLAIRPDIGRAVMIAPNRGAASVSLSNWGNRQQDPVRFGSWEGDTLIVESALDEGTRVIQSYYVDAQGLLVQDTEVNRAIGDPIVIKRVFQKIVDR